MFNMHCFDGVLGVIVTLNVYENYEVFRNSIIYGDNINLFSSHSNEIYM